MLKKLFQEDVDMDTLEFAEEMVKDAISKQMRTIDKKFKDMEERVMETTQLAIPELVQTAVNEEMEKRFAVELEERMEELISSSLSDMLMVKKLKLSSKMEDLDRDFFYRKGKGLLSDKDEYKFNREIREMEEAISFIDKISIVLRDI